MNSCVREHILVCPQLQYVVCLYLKVIMSGLSVTFVRCCLCRCNSALHSVQFYFSTLRAQKSTF